MAIILDGTNGVTTNSGTVISASTIGVGGATPSTSGAGITFPATQSASSDANTLDDYEEGTWTPTIAGSGGDPTGVTYDGRVGFYTKIGRIVTATFFVGFTTFTGGSGGFRISGLPFTSGSTTGNDAIGGALVEKFVALNSSYTSFSTRQNSNTTFIELMQSGSNVAWTSFAYGSGVTSGGAGKYINATVVYAV